MSAGLDNSGGGCVLDATIGEIDEGSTVFDKTVRMGFDMIVWLYKLFRLSPPFKYNVWGESFFMCSFLKPLPSAPHSLDDTHKIRTLPHT